MHNWARSKRQSVLTLKHYTYTNVSTGRYSDCVNGGQRGTACLANYSKLGYNTGGHAGQLSPPPPACLPLSVTPVLPEAINAGSVAGAFLLLPIEHSALQMPKQGISAILTCLFSACVWHSQLHNSVQFSPQALNSCTGWMTLIKWAVVHFSFTLIVSIVTSSLIYCLLTVLQTSC